MLIQITNRCHMGCPHCMQNSSSRGKHMKDETFSQVMALCRETQPMVVSITGGEPTEHPNWLYYAKELLSLPSIRILCILTNGAWIEDSSVRVSMAKLIRSSKGRVIVQVYSNEKYYKNHEWTVSHESQYRSIGCWPNFTDPIFMQDIGRASKNCKDEIVKNDHVPSCINSHLIALQARSFNHFLSMANQAGKFCRPLIDPDGNIHMSESWLCPKVAHVSDGAGEVFRKMRLSKPCRKCLLYKNFEKLHKKEMDWLNKKYQTT